MTAVLDSTCLIGFERIGRLDLLPGLLDTILVPPEVVREFGQELPWFIVEPPTDPGMVAALKLIVDPGESEAIALAYERKVRIILDDRKAREAAQRLGLPVTGTVGLILKAKQKGLVDAIRPILEALRDHDFRIGADLRQEALRIAGE